MRRLQCHVSGARRPRFATSAGLQVVVYPRPDHLRNNWVILFVLHDPGDRLEKASGASTNAWASTSGRSSTMAMSISPPSFLIRAGASAPGLRVPITTKRLDCRLN